jgi:hypothetical protein
LEAGTPFHLDLRDHPWRLSISTICLEAGHSRNALYEGHPELLKEIKAAIRTNGQIGAQDRHARKPDTMETALATCRADRQRLISENTTLLLRAVTAEEALVSLRQRAPHALNRTDDSPEASY